MSSRIFTRENEHRMEELQKRREQGTELTDDECDELALLKREYHDFLDEGGRRLQFLHTKENTMSNSYSIDANDMMDTVQQGMKSAGKAVYFWGSLVATALPGYFGRKVGLTSGFLHWNFITDHLILGALPVVTQVGDSGNHLVRMREQLESRNQQLGLVLACLEDAEIRGFGINMISFADESSWHQYFTSEVQYISLPIPDTTAVIPFDDVANAVEQMHKCIYGRGRTVYVHCKAGKGRSWMVVMCYLTSYGGMAFKDAEALIRRIRSHINPSPSQRAFAAQFLSRMKEHKRIP
ncbi:Dual specificity phosphatase [Trypanosoma melophagium]|uniref:Dual specificity phosphatase n=1 Tax=Trypanosoma melophagium TaxID=715481 RepID=UPI00351A2A6E|nr:Dual specificity phosphatase [Trypanosoma melophagium]